MDNKDFREKSADVAKNFIHKQYDKSATIKELLDLADPQGFSWIGYMAPGFNRTEAEARDYYIRKQARKEIPMMKADGDRYDTQMIGGKRVPCSLRMPCLCASGVQTGHQ